MKIKISHQDLIRFLKNEADVDLLEKIKRLRKKEKPYDFLFEVISGIQDQYPLTISEPSLGRDLSLEETEELFKQVIAGNIDHNSSSLFYHYLISSPIFYERFLSNLSDASEILALNDQQPLDPEFSRLQNDEKLLQSTVFKHLNPNGLNVKKMLLKFTEYLLSYRTTPKYVIAFSTVIVFLIAVYVSFNLLRKDPFLGFYDARPPVDISQSEVIGDDQAIPLTFRSTTGNLREQYYAVFIAMYLSKSDFKSANYKKVIENLQSLESISVSSISREIMKPSRETKDIDPELIRSAQHLSQEYYFFLGITHLAYSMTDKTALSEQDRRYHLNESMRMLKTAQKMRDAFNIDTQGREEKFLEQAYSYQKSQ